MALSKFEQLPDSESYEEYPPAYRATYLMVGINDQLTANSVARALLPATMFGISGILYLQPLIVNRAAHNAYEIEVYYGPRPFSQFEISISGRTTGGETIKILGSLKTVSTSPSAPSFSTTAGFGGLIGYNPTDQSVEGTEIPVPSSEYTISTKFPVGYLNLVKIDQLTELKGRVNSAPWLIWQAGEVRYDGNEFSAVNSTATAEAEFSCTVSIQKNLMPFYIGGLRVDVPTAGTTDYQPGIAKQGWDFLWLLKEDATDGGLPVAKAVHYYIERTMPRADFAAVLGFGAP